MPGLMAVIGADANPMRRELAAVQAMARTAGVNIQRGLGSGGHGAHSGSAGAIRESLVLMRELAAGNFTKVPGSLSILLQQIGILKFILKDTSDVSIVLAQAWQAQAEAASLAAIAATRKAAASQAALYAEGGETEATLAQAAADEEGAAAAILHAKATQQKAVASAEAVAASGAESSAVLSGLGKVGIAVIGIGVAAYAAYNFYKYLVDKLSDVKFADFNPEYIAKHLKAQNQSAELQKEINREILKSVDHYNSAAKAAERVAAATETHFDHLLELNELQNRHNPAKREAAELAIKEQRRNASLGNMIDERKNLETEGLAKQRRADAIKVSSKESDAQRLEDAKKNKDEAEKFIKETPMRAMASNETLRGKIDSMVDPKEQENRAEANRRIATYKKTVDEVAANDVIRKQKEELGKAAGASISKAVEMASTIATQKTINAQTGQNEFETAQAKLRAEKQMMHGSLTGNQQIGAYAAAATSTLLDLNRKQLYHLGRIDNALDKIGGGGGESHRNIGRVQH